jgi:hypothetical protein
LTQPEELAGDNAYHAGEGTGGGLQAYATRQTLLLASALPPVLVLQLKRFQADRSKDNRRLELDVELELQPFLMAGAVEPASPPQEGRGQGGQGGGGTTDGGCSSYELCAVLVHSGSTMFGHYWSFVRCLAPGSVPSASASASSSSSSGLDSPTGAQAWGQAPAAAGGPDAASSGGVTSEGAVTVQPGAGDLGAAEGVDGGGGDAWQWLCFNDATISAVTEAQVLATGGGGGDVTGASAYMAVYARKDCVQRVSSRADLDALAAAAAAAAAEPTLPS